MRRRSLVLGTSLLAACAVAGPRETLVFADEFGQQGVEEAVLPQRFDIDWVRVFVREGG